MVAAVISVAAVVLCVLTGVALLPCRTVVVLSLCHRRALSRSLMFLLPLLLLVLTLVLLLMLVLLLLLVLILVLLQLLLRCISKITELATHANS